MELPREVQQRLYDRRGFEKGNLSLGKKTKKFGRGEASKSKARKYLNVRFFLDTVTPYILPAL